jgi:hypothetical protein
VAAPASVALAAIFAEPRRLRHWGLAIAVAGGFGLLYLLKSSLPGSGIPAGGWLQSIEGLSSVSLVLLPAAVIGAMGWRHDWKRRDVAIGAELGLLVVGIRVLRWFYDGGVPPGFMWGGVASVWGAPPPWYAIGGKPLLFSELAWAVVGVLVLLGTVVVAAVGTGIAGAHFRRSGSLRALTNRLGSPIGLLVLFSITGLGGLTLYGLRFPVFDRYYWPLVPVAATLFLYSPRRLGSQTVMTGAQWRRSFAGLITAVFSVPAILSVILMLNSLAFDSARWRGGERLVQLGASPDEVDAGYEWVGYYQPVLPRGSNIPPEETFYETSWPGRRECGFVSSRNEAPTGATFVGTTGYSLLLIAGPQEILYLYRVTSADCLS